MRCGLLILFWLFLLPGSFAQLSYLQWSFGMSGNNNSPSYVNEVWSVCSKSNGQLVAAGAVAGSIDLDPSGATFNAVSFDNTHFSGFVAVYDTLRNFIGGSTLYSPDQAFVKKVASDAGGNVLVAGEFINQVEMDPGAGVFQLNAAQGGRDMFLAKYAQIPGIPIWAFNIGGNSSVDYLADMQTDAAGNIYITGAISDTTDFDPGPGQYLLNGTAGSSMFLAKYSPAGNFLWAFLIDSSPSIQEGKTIAFDSNGNVLVGLIFSGTVDADPSVSMASFTAAGSRDVLIAAYTASGAFVNAFKVGGGSGGPLISEASIDINFQNDIFLVALYTGTLDIDPGTGSTLLSSSSGASVFLARYSATGSLTWGSNVSSSVTNGAVQLDANGNAYVNVTGNSSGAIVKYDPAGVQKYVKSMGSSNNVYARCHFVEAPDVFYAGGGFRSSMFIDGNFVSGGSGYSAFLARFASCIPPQILSQSGSADACEGNDVLIQVSAIGTGLHYQWYKDNVVLSGDTLSQLQLMAVDTSDSGTYTCIITGACGADTSNGYSMVVHPDPVIIITTGGGQLTATPGFATYIWLLNNQPVTNPGNVFLNPSTGLYSVIGITAAGCTDTSFTVAVTGMDNPGAGNLLVYPNPAQDQLFINQADFKYRVSCLKIMTTRGACINEYPLLPGKLNELALRGLEPGIYFLAFYDNEKLQLVKRIVIQ